MKYSLLDSSRLWITMFSYVRILSMYIGLKPSCVTFWSKLVLTTVILASMETEFEITHPRIKNKPLLSAPVTIKPYCFQETIFISLETRNDLLNVVL